MSLIQKAMQHGNECQQNPSQNISPADIGRQTISGNYGIDSLFAKKSRRLSFAEFCSGLKDIFLAIPIFACKLVAAAFDIVKRPACALGLVCIAAVAISLNPFGGKSTPKDPDAQRVAAIQSAPPIRVQKSRIFSDIDEHIAANNANQREKFTKSTVGKIKKAESTAPIASASQSKTRRAFENKLHEFFTEHTISDVVCVDGCCKLKLENGIFSEHSTLCNNPKIVLESSTDDAITFSDGTGTFCTLAIESLLR